MGLANYLIGELNIGELSRGACIVILPEGKKLVFLPYSLPLNKKGFFSLCFFSPLFEPVGFILPAGQGKQAYFPRRAEQRGKTRLFSLGQGKCMTSSNMEEKSIRFREFFLIN